jgi:hypothetical protein
MSETIWKVDVSDEFLEFTEVPRPEDFESIAVEHDYDEFGGTYCGNRGFGDKYFKLHRKLKASNFYSGYCGSITSFKDEWGNFSLRRWREAFGFAYAWSPSTFYDYKGQLYTKGCNFL